MSAETITYSHYGKCCRIFNGEVEALVTLDIGPRIIRYGFVGGANALGELRPDEAVETALGSWHPWGGHRLWHAPEVSPRTYSPDDSPVESVDAGGLAAEVVQAVEPATGIRKQMRVELHPNGTCLQVTHTLTNTNLWAVELAPWALTITRGGGVTIVPQEPFASHAESLLPARPLVLWSYTDLSDPRWTFHSRYLLLRSDPGIDTPQKIGAANKQGWAAHLCGGELFVKRFPYAAGAAYPDYGCNFETFTKGSFMEVETLGPLAVLQPQESASHVETWHLFAGVDVGDTEASLHAAIAPLIAGTRPV